MARGRRRPSATLSAPRAAARCVDADGRGPAPAAGRGRCRRSSAAVLGARGWSLARRASRCCAAPPAGRAAASAATRRSTVAELAAGLPRARCARADRAAVRRRAQHAGRRRRARSVFLRVLRDALFAGPGLADLLLPRVGLGASVAAAGRCAWLSAHGATIRLAPARASGSSARTATRLAGRRRAASTRVVLACQRGRGGAPGRAASTPAWAARAAALALRADRHGLCAQRRHAPAGADARAAHADARRARRSSCSTAAGSAAPAGPAGLRRSAAPAPGSSAGSTPREAATLARRARSSARICAAPLECVRTIVEKRATFPARRGCAGRRRRSRRAVGGRRLRRRALPRHAGRRGAQRHRRRHAPLLIPSRLVAESGMNGP